MKVGRVDTNDTGGTMTNPFLIGDAIYLRAPEPGDELVIATSENHPSPRETLFYALPSSLDQQFQKLQNLKNDPHSVAFVICSKETDEILGQTFLTRIEWIGRTAIFYIAIAEESNWSKGYGGEATRMMVDYAFSTLNLNRVQLHVALNNEKGIRAYKRAGFIIEGTLREAMYLNNVYTDFYVMAILRKDWESLKQ